ncbi:hypothetical protein OAF63_06420 [Saprospiraceae bacterium]|jgi:predicted HicB family RNase H-like nuclease|nr:hypothetical protein [Bacteroidota bacterium]MDB4728408.1 hypothetical protein [Saprospiraceae bacterium]MDF1866046.1 hypothetical protein [Saprospiraceae bacterium]
MAKENSNESLKVLRVNASVHQQAKVKAAERGVKLQTYIENLIAADLEKLIDWEKKDAPNKK